MDQDTHIAVRNVLLATVSTASSDHIAFTSDHAGFVLIKPWSDVLDKNIKCLRFLQSNKAGPCLHSKEERKTLKCNGRKKHKLDFGRQYKIINILKFEGGEFLVDRIQMMNYKHIHDDFIDDATEKKLVSF